MRPQLAPWNRHFCAKSMAEQTTFRVWHPADDQALRRLMEHQLSRDPTWPPAYARAGDLARWLGEPATLGRWVALSGGSIVGHAGLGVPDTQHDFHFCAQLACAPDDLAVICRMVVAPANRIQGLASLLTRKALRCAIEQGRIPVAEVLTGRGTWLKMMLDTGWREAAVLPGIGNDERLVLLTPPQHLVAAAQRYRAHA